jgi:outer membrane receptor protein involved in Fe transport
VFQDQLTDLRKFTQEVRVASPSNDRFEWLVGGYYTKERGTIDQFIGGLNLNTGSPFVDADFIDPALGPIFGPFLNNIADATLKSKYTEIAGFGNFTWHITDRFDLTAGGRWSENAQRAEQVSVSALFGSTGPSVARSIEQVFTYSVAPRFEVNDNTSVYARVAKGYRPGGPNVVPAGAPPEFPETYDADTVTSYEAGLKMDVGRRLSLDVAAFYLKWNDIQLFSSLGVYNFNANGGEARSSGLEGTVALRPMRGLNVTLNGAYIDAELTERTDPIVGGGKGSPLPYVPKVSFGANADYEWALNANSEAFVGASLRYVGRQRAGFRPAEEVAPGEFDFIRQRRIDDYAQLDLRAGAEFGRFTLEAYVRNVTNTRGVTSLSDVEIEELGGNALPNGGLLAAFTQPRTIGFTLGAEF